MKVGLVIEDGKTLIGETCEQCGQTKLHDAVRPEKFDCACNGSDTATRLTLAKTEMQTKKAKGFGGTMTITSAEVLQEHGPPRKVFP